MLIAEEVLNNKTQKRPKKQWMTNKILEMMEERRIYKSKNKQRYTEIHTKIIVEGKEKRIYEK